MTKHTFQCITDFVLLLCAEHTDTEKYTVHSVA